MKLTDEQREIMEQNGCYMIISGKAEDSHSEFKEIEIWGIRTPDREYSLFYNITDTDTWEDILEWIVTAKMKR